MQPLGPSEVDADSIDIWVVSHGGVASNALCDHLQNQGLRTRPENYGLICHKKHPGDKVGKPILVIHGDYLDAIRSMDRRKFLTANAAKMCLGIDAPEIPLTRFLDSFPDDPLKSGDADLDGVEDSLDTTDSEFKFNWNKYTGKTIFSAYEKNKLN